MTEEQQVAIEVCFELAELEDKLMGLADHSRNILAQYSYLNLNKVLQPMVEARKALIKLAKIEVESGFCPICSMWFDEGCVNEDHKRILEVKED